ncbi:MAG: response regulator transcription factor [Dehalococcoidales bacterium]|nr:response regulator transcription factor [Dehalococcoidales bacterium]
MITILIIDSYSIFRNGLKSIFEKHPECSVIGSAASSSEALNQLGDLKPDIIVIDIYTSEEEGVNTITLLQNKFPQSKFLVFTTSNKEEDFLQAITAGARGYLLKSVQDTELIECIRLMATGDVIISPLIAFRSLEEFGKLNNHKSGNNSLSPREREVLQLVAQGASNKEIATRCFVSETTAKAHLRRILEKLKVKNRAQAAALAVSHGLLDKEDPNL